MSAIVSTVASVPLEMHDWPVTTGTHLDVAHILRAKEGRPDPLEHLDANLGWMPIAIAFSRTRDRDFGVEILRLICRERDL